MAAARNRGIAQSTGEWIAPIDADDLWHPTRLEKMVAAALNAPGRVGFVYCWCRNIDQDDRITGTGPSLAVQGPAFTRLAFLNAVGNGSALPALRGALLETGGYDPSLRAQHAQGAEDMLAQIRIARRHPVALVPEYLVGWRNAGESMSSDVEQMDRSIRLIYRRLAEDGTPVPNRLQRGMAAMSALDTAENYAAAGDFIRAAPWLGRALRLDPFRSTLFVAYRVARSARRRFGPAPSVPQRQHFFDADPTSWVRGDPYRLDRFASLLEAIDRRRLDRLETKDAPSSSLGSV